MDGVEAGEWTKEARGRARTGVEPLELEAGDSLFGEDAFPVCCMRRRRDIMDAERKASTDPLTLRMFGLCHHNGQLPRGATCETPKTDKVQQGPNFLSLFLSPPPSSNAPPSNLDLLCL